MIFLDKSPLATAVVTGLVGDSLTVLDRSDPRVRGALQRFNAASPSALEQREKLEQLRAMELGMSIWAAVVQNAPISVDTPADLEAARAHARTLR